MRCLLILVFRIKERMKPKILIMDNTTSIRNPWKRVLAENYDVTEVIGGFEAITRLKTAPYVAVIVNISLSSIKGVDAIRKIREKFSDISIFVVYEPKDSLNLRQATVYGIKNSFPTPVDPTNVLAALSKFKTDNGSSYVYTIGPSKEGGGPRIEKHANTPSPNDRDRSTGEKESKHSFVDIEARFYEGLSAIAANRIDQAILIYREILSLTNIKREKWLRYVEESLFHLGQCYARLKDYEKSNKCYSDFVTRAPHHNCVKEALLYLGRNHEAMHDFEKASAYYRKVINMRPFDSFSTQARKFLNKISKS
jgi:tetratricopeptide (TPR) repeat protein